MVLERDRKILKINMFINNIPDSSTPIKNKTHSKLQDQEIQTEIVVSKS